VKKKKIKAIDLFCGIGGMTHGLINSGIEVVAGFDIDKTCKYGYEINNKGAKFYSEDIKKLNYLEISKLYKNADIRILVGCAPCQPFSKHTQKIKNRNEDDKWSLLKHFGEIIKSVKPEIISMENVPQLRFTEVYQDFLKVLVDNNYFYKTKIVYCPNYGIPQTRSRLVLLASKFAEIELLSETTKKEDHKTVRDTIENLEKIDNGQSSESDALHKSSKFTAINLERIKQSTQGRTWRDWDESLLLKCHQKETGSTYPSVYGRMNWDKPSPTITTQFYNYGTGRFGHPEQNRAISLREGALLQTFPQDYKFYDEKKMKKTNTRKLGVHIGNAVPPQLGFVIGKSILIHLEDKNER
jgi:DNA (cytosine-5)-methyltransferase 1